jgi:hypothetical protein
MQKDDCSWMRGFSEHGAEFAGAKARLFTSVISPG